MSDFDTSKLGLLSHYNSEIQNKIRRLILEDWKLSDAKLPTYMKLVSRYVIPLGVADDWLKKLSHQTMSKMLNRTSTPRYEFWACLHLYLNKKYGNIGLEGSTDDEITQLGQSLSKFTANDESISGAYRLDDTTVIRLNDKTDYQHIAIIEYQNSNQPFADTVYKNFEGVCITKNDQLIGLCRSTDKGKLRAFEKPVNTLLELDNSNLKRKLAQITGDV